MDATHLGLLAGGAILFIFLLHRIGWTLTRLLFGWAGRVPPGLWGLSDWFAAHRLHLRFAARYPRLYAIAWARLSPASFAGLTLTLMVAAALYVASLQAGLIFDVFENDNLVRFDKALNAFLALWRTAPLIDLFLWITVLGAGPTITMVALVASAFLWADARRGLIVPLWLTLLGAEATSWSGKYLVGRVRPDFIEAARETMSALSPSYPSGHATASMAVYGFLAYAIARDLGSLRSRFEVAFWTSVLVGSIGFSRMFLSLHFASDVAGGFLVGGFWLLAGFILAERSRTRP